MPAASDSYDVLSGKLHSVNDMTGSQRLSYLLELRRDFTNHSNKPLGFNFIDFVHAYWLRLVCCCIQNQPLNDDLPHMYMQVSKCRLQVYQLNCNAHTTRAAVSVNASL